MFSLSPMTPSTYATLEITADQVLAGQGIDASSASPRLAALRAVAERVLAECRGLLEPRVASRRLAVAGFDADGIRFEGGLRVDDAVLAARMQGASEVVFAVCTVGEAVSRYAASKMPLDPVSGLAVEGLACAGVEGMAAAFCDGERHRAAAAGLRVTAPLSPGMDEWPIPEGQRAIFGVVDAASIGVRLSESWQMYPTKSTSFAIGIGAGVQREERERVFAVRRTRALRVAKAGGGRGGGRETRGGE